MYTVSNLGEVFKTVPCIRKERRDKNQAPPEGAISYSVVLEYDSDYYARCYYEVVEYEIPSVKSVRVSDWPKEIEELRLEKLEYLRIANEIIEKYAEDNGLDFWEALYEIEDQDNHLVNRVYG